MKLPTINAKTERPTRARPHVEEAHAAVEGDPPVRLNVEMPAALHRAVKMKAAQEGKSIKEVVLTLLARYSS
jgi:predicted HicB family RNase H-like nuclease